MEPTAVAAFLDSVEFSGLGVHEPLGFLGLLAGAAWVAGCAALARKQGARPVRAASLGAARPGERHLRAVDSPRA